jgi:hypothetical protein
MSSPRPVCCVPRCRGPPHLYAASPIALAAMPRFECDGCGPELARKPRAGGGPASSAPQAVRCLRFLCLGLPGLPPLLFAKCERHEASLLPCVFRPARSVGAIQLVVVMMEVQQVLAVVAVAAAVVAAAVVAAAVVRLVPAVLGLLAAWAVGPPPSILRYATLGASFARALLCSVHKASACARFRVCDRMPHGGV